MVEITIQASHLMESNPHFAFAVMNEEHEVFGWIKGHPGIHSSFRTPMFELNDGEFANAVLMRPFSGTLTPKQPLTFQLRQRGDKAVHCIDVLHDQGQNQWVRVPPASQDS